jgi:hypothetical protein
MDEPAVQRSVAPAMDIVHRAMEPLLPERERVI